MKSQTFHINNSHVLLYSVQKFVTIALWLPLALFICLYNQLSSIHSIVTYQEVQMLEKGGSSNKKKMNDCSFQQVFYAVSFQSQQKDLRFYKKIDTNVSQNRPTFERSGCFYVIITVNFECFHSFNLEANFLNNEILF